MGKNIYYKTSINIKQPIEQIFNYMTDFCNSNQLADQVASWKNTVGPVGVGTRFTERVKKGPFSEDVTCEIMALEPNRLCTFEGDNVLGRTQVSCMFQAV